MGTPSGIAKSTAVQPIRIFVCSPGDVHEERRICSDVISEWKRRAAREHGTPIEPFLWEDEVVPNVGSYAQHVVSWQTATDDRDGWFGFDIVIAILWTRLGTPTKYFLSGTAEELVYTLLTSVGQNHFIMLYTSDAPQAPSRIDPIQLARVNTLRSCFWAAGGLHFPYTGIEEFTKLLREHLPRAIDEIRKSRERSRADGAVDLRKYAFTDRRKELPENLRELLQDFHLQEERIGRNHRTCEKVVAECARYFSQWTGKSDHEVGELRRELQRFCADIDARFRLELAPQEIELYRNARVLAAFSPLLLDTVAPLKEGLVEKLRSAMPMLRRYEAVILEVNGFLRMNWPAKLYRIPENGVLGSIQREAAAVSELSKQLTSIAGLVTAPA
ncbi:hypothetical protein SAMN05519104_0093 [Rhizobiales bacterium GAS188]|nr:hypothetical protein SAMN05519104_0093 [Rhizobiales bacterium GAS188]